MNKASVVDDFFPVNNLVIDNRYIVTFKEDILAWSSAGAMMRNSVFGQDGFSSGKASGLIKQHGGKVKGNLKAISGVAAELTPAQLKKLRTHPEIRLIEAGVPRIFS